MSAPEAALPAHSTRKLAFSLNERHGVLYSRDPHILRTAVGLFLTRHLFVMAGEMPGPAICDPLLDDLIEPLDDDCWREVELSRRGRYWTLELPAIAMGSSGERERCDELRWVGRPGETDWQSLRLL